MGNRDVLATRNGTPVTLKSDRWREPEGRADRYENAYTDGESGSWLSRLLLDISDSQPIYHDPEAGPWHHGETFPRHHSADTERKTRIGDVTAKGLGREPRPVESA